MNTTTQIPETEKIIKELITKPSLAELVEQLQDNDWVKLSSRSLHELQSKHRCPACEKQTDTFVTHHWYESIGGEDHEIDICPSCNSMLSTKNFYEHRYYKEHKDSLHHVLPSWDKQLEWLRQRIEPPKEGFLVTVYRGMAIYRYPGNPDGWEGRPTYAMERLDSDSIEEVKLFIDEMAKTKIGEIFGMNDDVNIPITLTTDSEAQSNG